MATEREWLEGGPERNWLEGDTCPDCHGRGFTSWDASGTLPPTICQRCTPQPICDDCGCPEMVFDALVDAMVQHVCTGDLPSEDPDIDPNTGLPTGMPA